MKINVLTLFPEAFDMLEFGVIKKAIEKGAIELNLINFRDFSKDKHKKVDDTPFGGGAGMVLMPEPIHNAMLDVDKERKIKRIYMSPKGKALTQKKVIELSKEKEIIILCGHYEGVDQRVLDMDIDEEISIGDYILTSGELPAMVLINAISRYVDGVLGCGDSLVEESFSKNLLEYPQYTKPQNFLGKKVPDVLLSGNHQNIKKWREDKALEITKELRPDLLE